MNPETFSFDVDIDDEFITVRWERLPTALEMLTRYPQFQIRFKYNDISSDTVRSMLRDMEVPAHVSDAIITRITATAG